MRLVEKLRYAGETVESPPVLANVAGASSDDWREHVNLDQLRRGVSQVHDGLEAMRDTVQEVQGFMLGAGAQAGFSDEEVAHAATSAASSVNLAISIVAQVSNALGESDPLGILSQLSQGGGQSVAGGPPDEVRTVVEETRERVRHAVDDVNNLSRTLLGAAAPESILADVQRLGDLAGRLATRVEDGLDRALEAFGAGAATATWFLWGLAGLAVWAFSSSRGRR